MKISATRRRGVVALKLDISRAYDKIEWDYLEGIMIHMGFPAIWVERVMECVSSVSYSFKVNGHLTSTLIPQRGLRQGDPLSPYLFLICAEGLGALVKYAYYSKMLKGVRLARNAPVITHLLFADDSLIFSSAVHRLDSSVIARNAPVMSSCQVRKLTWRNARSPSVMEST